MGEAVVPAGNDIGDREVGDIGGREAERGRLPREVSGDELAGALELGWRLDCRHRRRGSEEENGGGETLA